MTLSIAETPVPLTTDSDGVVRVARTRVTLDTVVAAFVEGATAEEIAQQYPSLDLADVYSVLANYLRHRSEVDAYLHERQEQAEAVRTLDKARLVDDVKATRDLIGFLDRQGHDNVGAESRAAWPLLWDGMRDWDNGKWDWPQIVTGTALAELCCPPVEEPERVVLARGSTAH